MDHDHFFYSTSHPSLYLFAPKCSDCIGFPFSFQGFRHEEVEGMRCLPSKRRERAFVCSPLSSRKTPRIMTTSLPRILPVALHIGGEKASP